MPRRLLIGVLCALLVALCAPSPGAVEGEPRFQMGFKLLADMIPEIAGLPLEDERHNALNGDGLQMTTRGLMAWRKADNWTAFEWEADAASFATATERPQSENTIPVSPLLALEPLPLDAPTATLGLWSSPTSTATQEPLPTVANESAEF